jgi:Cysteine-rich secretory protein family
MKITAFALFCALFGSFGHYPPPAEEIQSPSRSVSSQTETENMDDETQPKLIATQNEESIRPGFARRERHRAIRSKSGHAQDPAHSGLYATIPGRAYPLGDSLFKLHFLSSSPRSVSPQTETTLTDSVAIEPCLSSEEKKLYDLIMAYRKSKRLPAIPYSAKLSKVAQTHVHDLEANYNYENASTCNPHSWSDKGTWTSCCYTSDHKQASCMWTKPKEIAGYEGYGYEIAYYSSAGANATEGLEGWKKSPGHNPLIINSGTWSKVKWQAIGIGIYGQYGVVWFGEEADESKMKLCK